jgi:XTP/dITP diphosphohydrolase
MRSVPRRILLATRNQGKVEEIRRLVRDLPVELLSLGDVDRAPEVLEDRDTFEENALKKAREIAYATELTTLADDSGLCVDALGGRPGIVSARYAGATASDEEKCARILEEMSDVPDDRRSARFVCVLALVSPQGEERLFRGECQGRITRELRGIGGFGYDPIFSYEDSGQTFAEMDRESKNAVSHRGRALRQFAAYLRTHAEDPNFSQG